MEESIQVVSQERSYPRYPVSTAGGIIELGDDRDKLSLPIFIGVESICMLTVLGRSEVE